MQKYQPNVRFLLLDEGALVRQGGLPEENLAALLFRLEHNRGLEPSRKMMQTVLRLTQGPEFTEVRRAFTLWINHLLLPRHLPELATEFAQAKDLSETITMLTAHKHWGYQFRKEGEQIGLEKGRLEGRQEGRLENAISTLSMQIEHRFGPLPAWARVRLEQAQEADLQRWTLKVLDVSRVEDIFSDL